MLPYIQIALIWRKMHFYVVHSPIGRLRCISLQHRRNFVWILFHTSQITHQLVSLWIKLGFIILTTKLQWLLTSDWIAEWMFSNHTDDMLRYIWPSSLVVFYSKAQYFDTLTKMHIGQCVEHYNVKSNYITKEMRQYKSVTISKQTYFHKQRGKM